MNDEEKKETAGDGATDTAGESPTPPMPAGGGVGDEARPGRREHPRWLVPLAVAVAVAVLAAAGAGGWLAWTRHELNTAQESCETMKAKAGKAAAEYKKLTGGDTVDAALKTDASTVKDAGVIEDLSTLVKAKTPATVSCRADSRQAVDEAADQAGENADWYGRQSKKIDAAVKAVSASVLDKTVDDANALLKSSEGKVQDDKTRETLQSAIKDRDADAITKASKNVNDSIAAKTKADKEAAEKKAREEAAAQAAAQAQAQTAQQQSAATGDGTGYGYSGGGSGYSPSGNGGTVSGGATSGGTADSGSAGSGGGSSDDSGSDVCNDPDGCVVFEECNTLGQDFHFC